MSADYAIIRNGDEHGASSSYREAQVTTRSKIAIMEAEYGEFAVGSQIYVEDEKWVSTKLLNGTWDARI